MAIKDEVGFKNEIMADCVVDDMQLNQSSENSSSVLIYGILRFQVYDGK